jgi:hypothetical protein
MLHLQNKKTAADKELSVIEHFTELTVFLELHNVVGSLPLIQHHHQNCNQV